MHAFPALGGMVTVAVFESLQQIQILVPADISIRKICLR
jgi:hypothetical protein